MRDYTNTDHTKSFSASDKKQNCIIYDWNGMVWTYNNLLCLCCIRVLLSKPHIASVTYCFYFFFFFFIFHIFGALAEDSLKIKILGCLNSPEAQGEMLMRTELGLWERGGRERVVEGKKFLLSNLCSHFFTLFLFIESVFWLFPLLLPINPIPSLSILFVFPDAFSNLYYSGKPFTISYLLTLTSLFILYSSSSSYSLIESKTSA